MLQPTSDSDVKVKSFTKNNSHTCKFVRSSALHSLPSKRPSKASKYSPNSRGLRGQPCFTPCWHLKLEDTFAWMVDAYDILGIHHLQASQKVSLHPEANQHLPQHFTRYSIERLFKVHKATIIVVSFLPCSVLSEFAI